MSDRHLAEQPEAALTELDEEALGCIAGGNDRGALIDPNG